MTMTEYQRYLSAMCIASTGGIVNDGMAPSANERETAASTLGAMDGLTSRSAAGGRKPMSRDELRQQIDLLCGVGRAGSPAMPPMEPRSISDVQKELGLPFKGATSDPLNTPEQRLLRDWKERQGEYDTWQKTSNDAGQAQLSDAPKPAGESNGHEG